MTASILELRIDNSPCAFRLVIRNIFEIAETYGDGAAARVLAELGNRVELTIGLHRDAVSLAPDGVEFWSERRRAARLLHSAALPVTIGKARVVMDLELVQIPQPNRAAPGAVSIGMRSDMEIASDVYDAISSGRTHLVVQPIARSPAHEKPADVLYWECLSRAFDQNGQPMSPGEFMPALERLGVTRFFDAHAVRSTIELLQERRHLSLGCNISALSALDDWWWSDVIATLSEDRTLARRLVIEITETASPADGQACLAFIERLRSLGCRIALDDFGNGFHSIEFARRCRPDIIKIDAGFLPRRSDQVHARRLFACLVALGAALAETVVIEGVEDEADLASVTECGFHWMQGYYFAKPAVPGDVFFDESTACL